MTHKARKHLRHRILLLLIFIPLLFPGSICCKRSKSFEGYNGSWWANTPPDQRLGFIDGFVDYYTYGCRKESKLCSIRNELGPAISLYYKNNRNDETLLVGEVLVQAARTRGAISSDGWKFPKLDKGGAFDGLIWLRYSPKMRLGYVEGYLNALMPQTSRAVAFPNNPAYYANAITRFYRTASGNQPQADAVENPLGKQIAQVLWDLRNQRK